METNLYKDTEPTVKEALEYAENIINTVHEPLLVLDADLKIQSANRSFYRVFKVTAEETKDQLIYNVGNRQWDIPSLRKLLEKILPDNASFDDYEVEHNFPDIGIRTMLLNARRIPSPPEKPRVILLAIEDITERKEVKEIKQRDEELEQMNKIMLGRELKIIELKKEIEELKKKLGEK
jgi:PAS domain S-box-containing protein